MKKILFLIALAAIVTSNLNAQTVWGVRLGLSWTTISGEEDDDSVDGGASIEAGPVLYHPLPNNFYINAGAMFGLKNIKEGEIKCNMIWLEVPVYAGYAIQTQGNVKPFVQAGPFLGLKFTENWKYESTSIDDMEWFGNFNAGLGILGGININRFKVELGYKLGLWNIADNDELFYDYKLTMSSLFLGINFIF